MLFCIAERYNRSGKRLLLQIDDETVCSLPPQWTDLVPIDPEVEFGKASALFRVSDLFDLEKIVIRLNQLDRQVKKNDL